MRPGDSYYAPTGFFGSFCNTISSCVSLLCCCWLFRDCFGRQQGPTTPLMAPPQRPVDDRSEQLRGPQSPFGGSKPPDLTGAMHDSLEPLGGPHSPFTPSKDDRLAHLGGPHSPFRMSNSPSHNPFLVSNIPDPQCPMDDRLAHLGGPHSPFGVSDAPGPPGQHRPPIQHESLVHHGPPRPHGPLSLPEPPRVPGVQPVLL